MENQIQQFVKNVDRLPKQILSDTLHVMMERRRAGEDWRGIVYHRAGMVGNCGGASRAVACTTNELPSIRPLAREVSFVP